MSVIEAIRCGCTPLLPHRLSYPEILPKNFHSDFLYKNQDDLIIKLLYLIENPDYLKDKTIALAKIMERYSWQQVIAKYDKELEKLAGSST